jgi:hypothetical protein
MSFSLRSLISRLLGRRPDLSMSAAVWVELVEGLRLRGRNDRESGAFLLGHRSVVMRDTAEIVVFKTVEI